MAIHVMTFVLRRLENNVYPYFQHGIYDFWRYFVFFFERDVFFCNFAWFFSLKDN